MGTIQATKIQTITIDPTDTNTNKSFFLCTPPPGKQPVGNGKRRRSRKTTGCRRGHSTGRYLYISPVPDPERAIFFLDRETGSALFIHTLISSKFEEPTGPEIRGPPPLWGGHASQCRVMVTENGNISGCKFDGLRDVSVCLTWNTSR